MIVPTANPKQLSDQVLEQSSYCATQVGRVCSSGGGDYKPPIWNIFPLSTDCRVACLSLYVRGVARMDLSGLTWMILNTDTKGDVCTVKGVMH